MSEQLQKLLLEFGCSVLNFTNDRIETSYFYSETMYERFLGGLNCRQGMGIHDCEEELTFNVIKDGTLVVIQKDGVDVARYKYVPIVKATISFMGLDDNNKPANRSLTFKIRQNVYSNTYNFIAEKEKEKVSLDFDTYKEVEQFLAQTYSKYKILERNDYMDKMLLIDLETQDFSVDSGIYEVACLVVENFEVVDQLYLAKEIPDYKGERKYGYGYYDISEDEEYTKKFKQFVAKYPYPIVAHNCPFDRKFLVYYEWIPENYPAYCSMRAIRMADNSLGSYALHNLIKHFKTAHEVEHTAMSDIINVYKLLKQIRPQTWISVGTRLRTYSKIKARTIDEIYLKIDATHMLDGEVVCFTGKSDYPRNTMQEIAIKNGAAISNDVTSKTTILVVGLDAGSKLDKAQEKGISIISDTEFMRIVNLEGKEIIA